MKSKWISVGVLSFIMTLGTFGCKLSSEGKDGASQQTAEPAAKITTVYAYGIVEARQHSTLSAKFPGKIERILVKEGEEVVEGQLLALFEAHEIEAQLEVARRDVKLAGAQLTEAQAGARRQEIAEAEQGLKAAAAELAKAQVDWQRADRLYADGSLAKERWEASRLKLDTDQANHNSASERLSLLREGTRPETIIVLTRRIELAEAQVKQAEAVLENARLRAPYAGVITKKHREEGEAMDIGLPVMDISTLGDLYVRAEIDETDIGRIRLGQATVVTADGFPGVAYRGEVVDIKHQMGPKLLIPTDPAKIIDFKVLDIEVSLPRETCIFPVKLPVNVRISLGK